jgi:tRNA G46 methylase TrmB
MEGNSSKIISNQTTLNSNLQKILKKHAEHEYKLGIPAQNYDMFFEILEQAKFHDGIILDSGCGTGESTISIAKLFPEAFVVGVDKSALRISKGISKLKKERLKNCMLVQANITYLWLFLEEQEVELLHNFILYPNPWPKKKHLKRRWHGHPVFPSLLKLKGNLTLRSNWEIYVAEFAVALSTYLNKDIEYRPLGYHISPLSNFEKKYVSSKHEIFEVTVEL